MEDEIDVVVDSWCGLVTSECSSPELCVFCVGVEGENRGVAGWLGWGVCAGVGMATKDARACERELCCYQYQGWCGGLATR